MKTVLLRAIVLREPLRQTPTVHNVCKTLLIYNEQSELYSQVMYLLFVMYNLAKIKNFWSQKMYFVRVSATDLGLSRRTPVSCGDLTWALLIILAITVC